MHGNREQGRGHREGNGMSSTETKTKSELIRHKEVQQRADIDLSEIKRRIASGDWPQPHSIMERTWRWRRADIEPWLETGEWPATANFKNGVGRGRAARG
jgi:predicted DNA-binding transcriptional regulator AlpA